MAGAPRFWKLVVRDVGELSEWRTSSFKVAPEELEVKLLALGTNAAKNILTQEEIKLAEEELQRLEGNEVSFDITAVVQNDDMVLAYVDLLENVPCGTDTPYLVLCHSQRVELAHAKQLLRTDPDSLVDSLGYDPPIQLRGVVALEAPGDPALFEGKLLKVETLPRLTAQTEPKGYATFVQDDLADAWKAKLAASVKAESPGHDECKLKANVQAVGKPGHLYLRWGASAGDMTAKDIGGLLEERLEELMNQAD